jgi:hypothetical protein
MMRKVTNNLPQIQSAPYAVMTNGADRFTLYSNFLPIDRCGEGDGAGDVEVVGEGAAVYLFRQAACCPLATGTRLCSRHRRATGVWLSDTIVAIRRHPPQQETPASALMTGAGVCRIVHSN